MNARLSEKQAGKAVLRRPQPEPLRVRLSPEQTRAYERLAALVAVAPVTALTGGVGSGRSLVLRTLADRFGGHVITSDEFLSWTQYREPEVTDEAVQRCVEHALGEYPMVIIDDFESVFHPHGRGTRGTRALRDLMLRHLYGLASRTGTRLVIGDRPMTNLGETAAQLFGSAQVFVVDIGDFLADDYAAICSNVLGEKKAEGIDFGVIHRYVAGLTGHQLRMVCGLLAEMPEPTTEDMIAVLERYVVAGNIRIDQVEALSFDALPGAEHITSRLETQIVLPMQNRELADRLGLKPKRGVLLYGPPGTGKTSIGRALAHRMRGKFFMIDGTFVTEPPVAFFARIRNVIREAKENAPSVLFIDDADVLFGIEHIAGLSRYLLTLLDGLESQSSSNVCVMMTAMDVRKVPEALLRSGRVELWLETRPPQGETRERVLQRWLGDQLPGSDAVDHASLSVATEGFTPADIRRVVGDAKSFYAADLARERAPATANDYLHRSVDALVQVRARMAELLGDENLRIGEGSRKEKYGLGVGGMAETGVGCKMSGW